MDGFIKKPSFRSGGVSVMRTVLLLEGHFFVNILPKKEIAASVLRCNRKGPV